MRLSEFSDLMMTPHFRETGAGPRGNRSRYIETDVGTVQSKYR